MGPHVRLVGHQLLCSLRIGYLPAHDLNEPSGVRVARRVDLYVVAVLERGLAVEQLLHLCPPSALFGLVTVRPGSFFRLETNEHKELAIVSDAARRSKQAGRRRTKLIHPSVDDWSYGVWVGHLATDDLREH